MNAINMANFSADACQLPQIIRGPFVIAIYNISLYERQKELTTSHLQTQVDSTDDIYLFNAVSPLVSTCVIV